MNKNTINDVKQKLVDMNKTIASLDPAIRSAAFDILAPYYFEDYEPPTADEKESKGKQKHGVGTSAPNIGRFFAAHEHTKPKDNVSLIAAWLYSQHGAITITAKMCRDVATQIGITISNRPDNTMRQAKRKGKNLFRQQGKGWQPTTHGELFLRETYGVRKGNKPLEERTEG
jgi:hypothetical protein